MRFTGEQRFSEPQRVLLVQIRRIGDTLLATPAIRALGERFPRARVDVIAEPPAEEALRGNPRIDRLLISPRAGTGAWLRFVREIRRERYDWAVDFLSNPRSAQYTFLSGAGVRLGLDRRGRRWAYTHRVVESDDDRGLYAADLKLAMLAFLGVPPAGNRLEVYHRDATETARVDHALRGLDPGARLVVVATGPPNDAKRYPAASVARVITCLRAQGANAVLTSGPGESAYGEAILTSLDTPVPHLENARVATLTALYARAALYLGPDSGPKHVAVASGLPTLTLFGPGRPTAWNVPDSNTNHVVLADCPVRPRCDEAECARQGHLAAVAPEVVIQAAEEMLAAAKRK